MDGEMALVEFGRDTFISVTAWLASRLTPPEHPSALTFGAVLPSGTMVADWPLA